MTSDTTPPDHRATVLAAQEWVAGLIDGVQPDQWHAPTPCTDFDVETLVRHLVGVADRLVAMGGGRSADSVSELPTSVPEPYAATYRERIEAVRSAWADDASLTRLVDVPWGQAPGAVLLAVYVAENLVHGWDLVVATGQPSEADPALVEPALAAMRQALPAEGREQLPFDAPVEPGPDAGPTERLASWEGHRRR